jgi:hypothetical protein
MLYTRSIWNLSQKWWISFQGKAQSESKAESRLRRDEPFILICSGTPPWTLRRIFEMGSKIIGEKFSTVLTPTAVANAITSGTGFRQSQ